MPKITPKSLSLNVDGKTVEIHSENAKTFELNKALGKPENFKEFAGNPQAFAGRYGLKIDQQISGQLKSKLEGVGSLAELAHIHGASGPAPATVWAVAAGAYSLSSTKIAVAF